MERFSLEIPLFPHMQDHFFDGKNMLSAAELLHLMSGAAASRFPGCRTAEQRDARFPRFLLLPSKGETSLSVQLEVEPSGEALTVRLMHVFQSGSGRFARLREHVSVRFPEKKPSEAHAPPFDEAMVLPGISYEITADKIYDSLIPFGPAYRNIRGRFRMTSQGAIALLSTEVESFPGSFPGVPLIFDAALQAACVWGQRYAGKVVFPVGYGKRLICHPPQTGSRYLCRVVPAGAEKEVLLFDLWIYDLEGTLCEAVSGLRMADVTAGRIQPPQWIQEALS